MKIECKIFFPYISHFFDSASACFYYHRIGDISDPTDCKPATEIS